MPEYCPAQRFRFGVRGDKVGRLRDFPFGVGDDDLCLVLDRRTQLGVIAGHVGARFEQPEQRVGHGRLVGAYRRIRPHIAPRRRKPPSGTTTAAPPGSRATWSLQRPPARSTSLRSPLLAIATVVIGLLVSVASYNLTSANKPRSQARADHLPDRRPALEVDTQTAQVTALQLEVNRLDAEALGAANSDLQARLDVASAVAGAVAVTGPGLVVTLDDAPGAAPAPTPTRRPTPPATVGTVFARDLQIVTNACGSPAPRRSASTACG